MELARSQLPVLCPKHGDYISPVTFRCVKCEEEWIAEQERLQQIARWGWKRIKDEQPAHNTTVLVCWTPHWFGDNIREVSFGWYDAENFEWYVIGSLVETRDRLHWWCALPEPIYYD